MISVRTGIYKKEDVVFLLNVLQNRRVLHQCTEAKDCQNCDCRVACNDMEYVTNYLQELLDKGELK